MGNRTKCALIFSIMMIVVILSACQQKTSVEKVYTVLENVAAAEKEFEQQQNPLVDLEKKENATYNKIIGLGMKQYDQIVKLSNQAISMADQRKDYIEKETKSIKKSEEEFKKMASLKDEMTNKELNKKANELYMLMMNRYKAHEILYKAYLNGITNDKQLYEMLKDKSISLDRIEVQINKVNAGYKEIYRDNDRFNKWTTQYNNKKLEFYKKAGLKSK